MLPLCARVLLSSASQDGECLPVTRDCRPSEPQCGTMSPWSVRVLCNKGKKSEGAPSKQLGKHGKFSFPDDGKRLREGRVTCDCCNMTYTGSEFEEHCGMGSNKSPWTSIKILGNGKFPLVLGLISARKN